MGIFSKKTTSELPNHIGIIMDGNGRWAKNQGKPRIFGHRSGMDAIERVAIHGQKRGIKVMTVYAFSTENWTRPKDEVSFIMSLPIDFYSRFVPVLNRENIQIRMIGNREGIPVKTLTAIDQAAEDTKTNTGMILVFAMNYGGRAEIIQAAKDLAKLSDEEITEEGLSARLSTRILPKEWQNPDLVIRTSGEVRLSNFLVWQAAYAELYFTETLWPDFDESELDQAIDSYQSRERRYGNIR